MRDWRLMLLAGVLLVTVGVLTGLRVIDSTLIVAVVSALLGWLVPSPLAKPVEPPKGDV